MEPFLADLINNPKVPKLIRYIVVLIIIVFIIYLGILCGIESPMLIGRIFGYVLVIISVVAGIYLIRMISKK